MSAIDNDNFTLQKGDWFSIKYGFLRMDVCVLGVGEDLVKWGTPLWLVSHATTEQLSEFKQRSPIYLGSTFRRWWWDFLPFINDVIFPYKSVKI